MFYLGHNNRVPYLSLVFEVLCSVPYWHCEIKADIKYSYAWIFIEVKKTFNFTNGPIKIAKNNKNIELELLKIMFLISQWRHMLLVLKRNVSRTWFFELSKHMFTGLGTWPWTNRFTSARITFVSSSSQCHMVDPVWIHILGKQRLPCVKGKVTVYVKCQCSENRCFWRVKDHKYQGPCCVAWSQF